MEEILAKYFSERVKFFEIPLETFQFLQSIRNEDWQRGEWLFICAVDRIPLQKLKEFEEKKYTIQQIRQQRQEHLKKMCVGLDPLYNRLKRITEETKRICDDSRQTKNILEENMEKVLEQQRQTTQLALESKDKIIQILEEQNKSLQKQLSEEKIRKMKREEKEIKVVEKPLEKNGKLNRIFLKMKNKKDTKKFIDAYLNNKEFTDEQISFFLDCLEEGMTVQEISRFASKNLSVSAMKRLKVMK